MALELSIPPLLGKAENAGDQETDLHEVLTAHHDAILEAEAAATTQEEEIGFLKVVSTIRTGNIGDFNFLSEPKTAGAAAFLHEQAQFYVAFEPDTFETVPVTATELMFQKEPGALVWVRADKLHLVYKNHTSFYLGTYLADEPSITNSGLRADQGLISIEHLARHFGNSIEGLARIANGFDDQGLHGDSVSGFEGGATVYISFPYPNPYFPEEPDVTDPYTHEAPGGDFGGALCAEVLTNTVITPCAVVRFDADGYALPALADSAPHSAGQLAIALTSANTNSGARRAVIAQYRDACPVLLETGIVPALGELLYLSETEAGRVTNVAPSQARRIGRVMSYSGNVCRALLSLD